MKGTIEDRVTFARHALTLIQAATQNPEAASDVVHGQSLVAAIHAIAVEALGALVPIHEAPRELLDWRFAERAASSSADRSGVSEHPCEVTE